MRRESEYGAYIALANTPKKINKRKLDTKASLLYIITHWFK